MMISRLVPRAAMAGAAALTLLLAACSNGEPAPQFMITGTGTVAGRLFFDADNNGSFSPIGGDTLLAGVPVEIRARGTARVLATTTTDAQGLFSFAGVPAGTQDLAIVRDTAITGSLVFCGFPSPTSVFSNEEAFRNVAAKRGCVIRVQAAEALALGSSVTVRGVVSAAPSTFRAQGDNIYVQDQTGGIAVFGPSVAGLNLQVGDTIEVTGVLSDFNGELQINLPQITPNIVRGSPAPAPRNVTVVSIASASTLSADVGRLIRLRKVRVTNFTSASDRDGTAIDATGGVAIRLDGNASLAIPPLTSFDAARCYDLTGILGIFRGTPQIKPRTLADVVEVPCT